MATIKQVDSDHVPVAILLQGDDIEVSYCGKCHSPAQEWEHSPSYHPCARPGVMFHAELFCAVCMPRGYDDGGSEVRSFCGMRHAFTDGEGYACGCFS